MSLLISFQMGEQPSRAATHAVRMRDGVALSTDVYLPVDPVPKATVLLRTPYDKSLPHYLTPLIADCVTERGFAFVSQDCRGKLRSDGNLAPFKWEMSDGYDCIDWICRQQWSVGKVATIGSSYDGFTQWAAAASGHPALFAIAPERTTLDIPGEWITTNGVVRLGFALTWAAFTWTGPEIYSYDSAVDYTLPLANVLDDLFKRREPALTHLLAVAQHAEWRQHFFGGADPAVSATVPTLHISGWFDIFQRGQLADWRRGGQTGRLQQLVIGPIDHFGGTLADQPSLQSCDRTGDAARSAAQLSVCRQLDFFEALLEGTVNFPAVKWRMAFENSWRVSDSWPPSESRPRTFFLKPDGVLSYDLPSAPEARTWIHDPNQLVPSQGSPTSLYDVLDNADDSCLASRSDVLTFMSQRFDKLALIGNVCLLATVGSSAQNMHLIVRLLDISPSGRSRRICHAATLVRQANKDQTIVIDLGDTAYRLPSSHCLALQVASSDFPRYLPYFGDDRDPWTAVSGVPNTQRIALGGELAARLVVGVSHDVG